MRRSVLDGLRQSGSLKLLFPRGAPGELQAVLVNTAGGVTGGDRFAVAGHAATNTELTLTTQAAERGYRALPGEIGRIKTTLTAARGGSLQWLPQETILFQGCALERSITVDLEQGARLLFVESLVFGRAAMGERLKDVRFHDRITIRQAGAPIFLDALQFDGDIAARLALSHVAAGAGAMATVVFCAPEGEAHLDPIRDLLPETGGASLLRPDLLVVRHLARDSHALRQSLVPILTRLRGQPLPRPWMI